MPLGTYAVKLMNYARYLSYFTDLSYIGLVAYFWASGVQTLIYAERNRRGYPLQNWPRSLQFLHILLFTTITTFRKSIWWMALARTHLNIISAILVTIVFWSLLASSSTFATRYSCESFLYPWRVGWSIEPRLILRCIAWSNISQHAMNTAFALFEIFLTHAGPSPWTHIPFLVIILACYLGVAYITHKTQGFYSTIYSSNTSN